MELIGQLQQWYRDRCDGDWEQAYGLTIETRDDPGWRVQIDIEETPAESREFEAVRERRSPEDWCELWVENNVFHGAGGPGNLDEILRRFLAWAKSTES